LRAAALAEQQDVPKVVSSVREAVLARLRGMLGEVAVDNYRKVTEVFDGWAAKFATTAQHADLDADGAETGRRPVIVMSRDAAIPRLHRTLVAPCIAMSRGLASEVVVEPDTDPVPGVPQSASTLSKASRSQS
jgi:hypothetical protein